ncbi:unnamed protein product [Bursaphelenchus xylophilus]|uniref:(pine wood nematode) hypothetical protein n=1 Tax=Bursaphelenchus xylophilus TaxID=6326 RepID=A0A1I7SCM9_BURXY|nr:unnamed protein product [Bursaphelenchus xylophilus]CAG9093824.1 unnamed protein product [Bursaphelenchus xylophilus]
MDVSTNITKLRVIFTSGMPAMNRNCIGYPVLVPRTSCLFPGLHTEILGMIARRIGLEIEPVIILQEQPYE